MPALMPALAAIALLASPATPLNIVDDTTLDLGHVCSWSSETTGVHTDASSAHIDVSAHGVDEKYQITVRGTNCADGQDRTMTWEASTPYYLASSLLATPDAARDRQLEIVVASEGYVRITLLKNGQEVTWQEGEGTQVLNQEIKDGHWQMKISDGRNELVKDISIARGWAPIEPGYETKIEPCSNLAWHLDDTGAPKRGRGVEVQIQGALDEISAATGLTFTRVETQEQAQLRYQWQRLGKSTAALGGPKTYNGQPGGSVTLSSDSAWGKNIERWGYDYPGRQSLILHETLHVLGLGHVSDPTQIMYSYGISDGASVLQDGDKAGLAALYGNCSN